jgi:NADH-quinone oxidoreductase subunit A
VKPFTKSVPEPTKDRVEDRMSTEFTPIFLFILLAIFAIAAGMVIMSHFLGPRRTTAVKQMPYESGMDPIGDARQRFDVRYYLVAIAFLLFDVELLYLYPWAVAHWSQDNSAPAVMASAETTLIPPIDRPGVEAESTPALSRPSAPVGVVAAGVGIPPAFRNLVFAEILVFIGVLGAAYAYAWKKGVFTWR